MSKWLVWAYAGILLLYTGWRTYDFMQSNLPKSDISFWLSIAFLFCTEAGLLLWHGLNLKSVTTETQDKVSAVMTWLDFIGSLAAGIADMILRQTFIEGYVIPPMLAQFLIFGLPLIMGVNVAAVIVYTSNDAKALEEKAEKRARFAIHSEAMKQIEAEHETLALEKADVIYSRIRGRVTGHVDGAYGQPAAHLPRRVKQPGLLGLLFHKWTRGLSEKVNNYLGEGQPQVTVYPAETQALPGNDTQENHGALDDSSRISFRDYEEKGGGPTRQYEADPTQLPSNGRKD